MPRQAETRVVRQRWPQPGERLQNAHERAITATRPLTWTPPVTPDSWPPSAAETGACLLHYPGPKILATSFQYSGRPRLDVAKPDRSAGTANPDGEATMSADVISDRYDGTSAFPTPGGLPPVPDAPEFHRPPGTARWLGYCGLDEPPQARRASGRCAASRQPGHQERRVRQRTALAIARARAAQPSRALPGTSSKAAPRPPRHHTRADHKEAEFRRSKSRITSGSNRNGSVVLRKFTRISANLAGSST
jgi:hypothetical protein